MFQVMWMFREFGAPYLFLHAILNQDVNWRKQHFRLVDWSLFGIESHSFWGFELLILLFCYFINFLIKFLISDSSGEGRQKQWYPVGLNTI